MSLCKDNATWSGAERLGPTASLSIGVRPFRTNPNRPDTRSTTGPAPRNSHASNADWVQATTPRPRVLATARLPDFLIPNANFDVETASRTPLQQRSRQSCGSFIVLETKKGGQGGDWVTQGGFEEYSTVKRPAPPQIRLIKHIVNDQRAAAVIADFGITLDNGSMTFGAGDTVGSTTTYSTDSIPTSVGAHSLKELDARATPRDLELLTGPASDSGFNTGSVTLAEGQFVACGSPTTTNRARCSWSRS